MGEDDAVFGGWFLVWQAGTRVPAPPAYRPGVVNPLPKQLGKTANSNPDNHGAKGLAVSLKSAEMDNAGQVVRKWAPFLHTEPP